MKIFNKRLIRSALKSFLVIVGFATIMGPVTTFGATTPSLGAASSYGILASTYTNTSAGTTVTGDIGYTTGPAVVPGGAHLNLGSSAPYATAVIDQGSTLSSLNSQACTFTFAAGAINLSTDTTHGAIGVYTPGVYCSTGAMNVGGPLSLNGSGTYIFRSVGALTSTAGATVTVSGASACDVFWTPTAATTLGANTTFFGTVISSAGITIGANTSWIGRSLAAGGTVTSDTDTITAPSCVSVPVVIPAPSPAILRVAKVVVNNNGGTAVASLFTLHVKLSGTDVAGSPAAGAVAPGISYSLSAGTYLVSEDAQPSYVQSFSGDCNANGSVSLIAGDNKVCIVTNTDIPTTPTSTPGPVVVPNPTSTPVPTIPSVSTPTSTQTPLAVVTPTSPTSTIPTTTVATPKLPNTGIAPDTNNTLWSLAGMIAVSMILSISFLFILKKRMQ